MDRLTKKYPNGVTFLEDNWKTKEYDVCCGSTGKCIDKLGKLEDLEEKLGIPLYMYVSIKENGIKFKEKDTKRIFEVEPRDILLDAKNDILFVYWENSNDVYCEFKISNLGKTWWLNEESE